MRWLIFGAACTLLGFTDSATAQDKTVPPLQRMIDVNVMVPLTFHDCTVPTVVAGLARRYHILAGIEFLPTDCGLVRSQASESINLLGLSVGEALDRLSGMDRRYRWVEHDGVIVIRPVTSWGDPENMLNFVSETFAIEDVTIGGALDAVVSAIIGKPRRGAAEITRDTRVFSVNLRSSSAGAALDAILRAHGDMLWQLHTTNGRRMLTFFTYDGSGIGARVDPQR